MNDARTDWIDDAEFENAQIKWNWSNFDGNDNLAGPGNYNFTITLTPEEARILSDQGWTVKENAPREEGDDPEFTFKIKASWDFKAPAIFFIKNGRKFRVNKPEDLADIRRDTCEKLDVICTPSRWKNARGETGVSAYVKEMYVLIKEHRFAEQYKDYEEV